MSYADFIYQKLVNEILDNGETRKDRTGVGTISLFGTQSRYDLRKGFPILTTKKINFASVVGELFWFLRGETNIKTLNSHIWDNWSNEDGELGPIYGKQYRDWNGIDQIAELINGIKTNPFSRRHIVSTWNLEDLPKMALPPCHILFQCYVTNDGYIDLQLYQRSADMALGVPYNVASYSLLLAIIANECNLIPRYFIHSIGDAHIYQNHIDKLKNQIERGGYQAPILKFEVPPCSYISGLAPIESVQLMDYQHGPFVKYDVAV